MTHPLPGRATPPNHVLFRELNGEAILLDLQKGHYYGLNEVGCDLWQLLTADPDVAKACAQLQAIDQVEPSQLEQDIAQLLADLHTAGLISLDNS